MDQGLVVELEKVCRAYDEPYYPSFARKLEAEEKEKHRFLLLAMTEGDELAMYSELDASQEGQTAVIRDDSKGTAAVVRVTQEGKWRLLRRFVKPPALYEEIWQEEHGPDLTHLIPRELVNELYRAMTLKLRRTSHLLNVAASAEAEAAAGKE